MKVVTYIETKDSPTVAEIRSALFHIDNKAKVSIVGTRIRIDHPEEEVS